MISSKIDYICIGYDPVIGGTETIVKNIAERMFGRGHDATLHTSTYNPKYDGEIKRREIINGVKVIRYRLFLFMTLPKKLLMATEKHHTLEITNSENRICFGCSR